MTTRKYSSRSQQTTLTGSLSASATTANIYSASNLLGGVTLSGSETFTVVIDPDTALEEIVDIVYPSTSGSNTITIVRGVETSGVGQTHSAGAVVRHMVTGRDLREANTHIEASTNVHGLAAGVAVVGDTTSQVLTNKTLTTPTIASFTNATHNHTNAAGGGTLTSAAISDFQEATEDVVGAMVSSNSESGISVTYDDATGKLNFDVSDPVITLSGDVTGSATITNLGNTTITTTIPAGTIVNADINSAAAIDKTKISGTAITAADTGTVTSTMIANGTIVDADINSAAAITKTKISGTAITGADVGTVNTTILADLAVTTAKLVDSNVTTAKIADLNVTTGKIADSAITSAKIADNTIVDADISTAAAIALSKLATDPLARANHTGTQTASTISDFDTQVRTSRLDQMTAPTANISLATYKVTNLGTPTVSTDASTKGYVDSQITALVGGAPGTLDTLNEIAAAINNSGSFATSVVLRDGSQAMTGALAMGTNKITGLGTPTASTDAVTKAYADAILVGAPGNLTGPITSVGAATSVASQTGTGSTFVMNTSPTIITPVITASSTTDALRITNTGTGNSLLVEDSANPDSTPFVIDQNGYLAIGHTARLTIGGNQLASLYGTGTNYPLVLAQYAASAATGARLTFAKSRSTTPGTFATVVTGDTLGENYFYGDDGTSFVGSSRILAQAEGTISTGVVPGRLIFSTADSAGTMTERMRIDSNGNIGIGAAASASMAVRLNKNLTGGTSAYGIIIDSTVQSDVTSNMYVFGSTASTAAAAFTLGSIRHFYVNPSALGAGSAITAQYGYYVESTLTTATNNFGFFGGINSGTGRWNLYMSGTADNYMAGSLGIGTSSLTGYSLRIGKNMTGSTSATGIFHNATVQSDVTSIATGVYTLLSTQAAAFTLQYLRHFVAEQNTIGAGSSVTTQYGFYAGTSLTGATNNYGFYSNVPSGAGDWGFYAGGTAANYFAGQTTVGSTSLTLGSGSVAQQFGVVSTTASNVVEVIRGAASQTGDLTQWQNSAGTVLSKINSGGSLELNGKDIELMTLMGAF